MPYQSITAPRVTFEELEKEKSSLTAAERYELYCGTRGFEAMPRETSEGLALVQIEIQRALDMIEGKEEYSEALRLCPDVVQFETHSLFFLRCCKYDPWAAAQRMVDYWKFRCEIFGKEKAFRRLTQMGGALSQEDLDLLRRGAIRLQGRDRGGRSVLYLRRSFVKLGQGTSLIRCLMYLHAVICRDSNDQRHGTVCISDAKYFSLEDHDRKFSRQAIRYQLHLSPLHTHALHAAFHTNRSFGVWIAPVLVALVPETYRKVLHCWTTIRPEQFVDDLEAFGISEDLLPPVMGGSNGLEQFLERLDELSAKETLL